MGFCRRADFCLHRRRPRVGGPGEPAGTAGREPAGRTDRTGYRQRGRISRGNPAEARSKTRYGRHDGRSCDRAGRAVSEIRADRRSTWSRNIPIRWSRSESRRPTGTPGSVTFFAAKLLAEADARRGVSSLGFKEKPDKPTADRYVEIGQILLEQWDVCLACRHRARGAGGTSAGQLRGLRKIADAWDTPRRNDVLNESIRSFRRSASIMP